MVSILSASIIAGEDKARPPKSSASCQLTSISIFVVQALDDEDGSPMAADDETDDDALRLEPWLAAIR